MELKKDYVFLGGVAMKKRIINLVIIFLIMPVISSASFLTHIPSCTDAKLCWSKLYPVTNAANEQAFLDACFAYANAYKNAHTWGSNVEANVMYDFENESACITYICCSQGDFTSLNNIEQTAVDSSTVTGVIPGQERQAAEAYAVNFFDNTAYPVVTDKVRTDGAVGFSYVVTLGEGETASSVNVIAWKRGIYTNTGSNPIPLGDLGGTGSGSGLSKSDTTVAFQDALTAQNLSADQIAEAIASHGTGTGSGGGGTTVNVDLTATNNILTTTNNKLDSYLGPSDNYSLPSGDDGGFNADIVQPEDKTEAIATLFTDFLLTMKTTQNSFFNLFSSEETRIIIDDEACDITAPVPFGTGSGIHFNLCGQSTLFNTMGLALMGLSVIGVIFYIFE